LAGAVAVETAALLFIHSHYTA